MPRRNRPRDIGAQQVVVANVREWLESNDRSVTWLAKRVTSQGCQLSAASLWKSLERDREIRVDEAVALAWVMGMTLPELLGVAGS